MDNVEVAGYCDIVPDLLDDFENNWQGRWPSAKPYTDYKQMLAEANLAILTVGTSDNRHADMVVDAANSGIKAIMCEKPLATTMGGPRAMLFHNGSHRVHALVFFADSEPTHVMGLLEEGFDHGISIEATSGKTLR